MLLLGKLLQIWSAMLRWLFSSTDFSFDFDPLALLTFVVVTVWGCYWTYSVSIPGACIWVKLWRYVFIFLFLNYVWWQFFIIFFLPSQLYDWKAAAQAGECKVLHRKSFCKVFPVAFVILSLHSVLEIICYLLIFIILAAGEFPISCGVQMFP